MADNKDLYDNGVKNGNLNSIKGTPKTIPEKIIGFGYVITLFLTGFFAITLAIAKRANIKLLLPFVFLCSISGYLSGMELNFSDPSTPAWMYFPWAVLFNGHSWGLNFEDWLFYPFCAILFYGLFITLKSKKSQWTNTTAKVWILITQWLIIQFFLGFSAKAGIAFSIYYAIPGTILAIYAWDRWDIKHYLKLMAVMVVFAGLWDLVGTLWLRQIWAWCSWWCYITFDASGVAHHSNVFIPYATHKWAWIAKTIPIEITPWMSLSSSWYVYFIMVSLEKVFGISAEHPKVTDSSSDS